MNIYHIKYYRAGSFGLCAVVIAHNETDARRITGLEHDYATNEKITVSLIGTATAEIYFTQIVCREVS